MELEDDDEGFKVAEMLLLVALALLCDDIGRRLGRMDNADSDAERHGELILI